MRASLVIALALPFALAGCPALQGDWTISGSGAVDASVDAAGPETIGGNSGFGGGGNSGSLGPSGSSGSGGDGSGGASAGGANSGGVSSGGTSETGGTLGTGGTCSPGHCSADELCATHPCNACCCLVDLVAQATSCGYLIGGTCYRDAAGTSACPIQSGGSGGSSSGGSSGSSGGAPSGGAGGAAPVCESLQGPTALGLTNAGAIGITFHSKVNATLVKFVFHNGGYADTVSLQDGVSCSVIASVAVPANVQSYTANVSWPLVANRSYRLVSSIVNTGNGYNETQAVTAPGGWPWTNGQNIVVDDCAGGADHCSSGTSSVACGWSHQYWFNFTDLEVCE